MLDSLCVIGHPSPLGGADTELDHQIHCWQAMGLEVHICPTGPVDGNLRAMNMEDRGRVYHAPEDWPSLEGLHCLVQPHAEMTDSLSELRSFAKSVSAIHFSADHFLPLIECQRNRSLDYHFFPTQL